MNKYRETIEIKKILDGFCARGVDVKITYSGTNHKQTYLVTIHDDTESYYNATSQITEENLYEYLKSAYFDHLYPDDVETIMIDFDDETLAWLYESADAKGITVDEAIVQLLRVYMSEIDELDKDIRNLELELEELKRKKLNKIGK